MTSSEVRYSGDSTNFFLEREFNPAIAQQFIQLQQIDWQEGARLDPRNSI